MPGAAGGTDRDQAFAQCAKLATVTIPSSVKTLGNVMFAGCDALESITYSGKKEAWKEMAAKVFNRELEEIPVLCTNGRVVATPNMTFDPHQCYLKNNTVYPQMWCNYGWSVYGALYEIDSQGSWVQIGDSFMVYDGETNEWTMHGIPGSSSLSTGHYGFAVSYSPDPAFHSDESVWDTFFVLDSQLEEPEISIGTTGAVGDGMTVTVMRAEAAAAVEIEVLLNDTGIYSEVVRCDGSNLSVSVPGNVLNEEGTYTVRATSYSLIPYVEPTTTPIAADSYAAVETVELSGSMPEFTGTIEVEDLSEKTLGDKVKITVPGANALCVDYYAVTPNGKIVPETYKEGQRVSGTDTFELTTVPYNEPLTYTVTLAAAFDGHWTQPGEPVTFTVGTQSLPAFDEPEVTVVYQQTDGAILFFFPWAEGAETQEITIRKPDGTKAYEWASCLWDEGPANPGDSCVFFVNTQDRLMAPGEYYAEIVVKGSGHADSTFRKDFTVYETLPDFQAFVLPEQIQVIGEEAFAGIQAAAVQVPEGCQAIRKNAFAGSGLEAIELPDSLKMLEAGAFPEGTTVFVQMNSPTAALAEDAGYEVVYLWP